VRGVVAVIALAVFILGCGQQEHQGLAPTIQATLTPRLDWLTLDRQERLADTVSTIAKQHGWAAGCVFRYNADESVLDQFARPEGRAA